MREIKLASFLILERSGKVLLGRRRSTGYADAKYIAPTGKVKDEEVD